MMLKDFSSSVLFVDTAYKPTWGIFSKEEWLEYHRSDDRKASDYLHAEIYRCLDKHGLKIKDVYTIVSSGPGSYTGMRLAQGFLDILSISNLKTRAFYHFDIPRLLGVEEGEWVTKAFKGEIFSYSWNKDSFKQELKKEDDHFALNLFGEGDISLSFESTREIIYEEANIIFPRIVKENFNREIFYFRSLDQEFPIKVKKVDK